jgi:hypothetical protein
MNDYFKLVIVNTVFFLVAFFYCGCNMDRKNYSSMEQENSKLKEQVKNLQNELGALSYRPIVIAKSSKIKLGEEYIADIRLAVVDTTHPPITVLCKWDSLKNELISLKDTLKYNKEFEGATYRQIPSTKGIHKWTGKVLRNNHDKQYEYGFTVEYEVY